MAFWPVMMCAAAALTVVGAMRGAWRVPATALCAYVATRAAVMTIEPTGPWDEIAVCTIWLCAASFMMYRGAWIPGALFVLSALVYPVFVVFGVQIGWLSVSNIIAEAFAILALLSIWRGMNGFPGGLGGLRNIRGFGNRVSFTQMGMASRSPGRNSVARKV